MSVIPAALEVELGRIAVQNQPGQKVNKNPISINKPGVVETTVVPAMQQV
jgi:hypothetical protein